MNEHGDCCRRMQLEWPESFILSRCGAPVTARLPLWLQTDMRGPSTAYALQANLGNSRGFKVRRLFVQTRRYLLFQPVRAGRTCRICGSVSRSGDEEHIRHAVHVLQTSNLFMAICSKRRSSHWQCSLHSNQVSSHLCESSTACWAALASGPEGSWPYARCG